MYTVQMRNSTGTPARVRVYPMPIVAPDDYWQSVTDVPCPGCRKGRIQWAEAGYVPGYRICDRCGAHYMAEGTRNAPAVARVPGRRG